MWTLLQTERSELGVQLGVPSSVVIGCLLLGKPHCPTDSYQIRLLAGSLDL